MLGAARARARGLERLAGLEGEARAQKAAADELRRQLAATLQRAGDLEEEAGDADRERAVAETQAAQLRLRLDEERELLGEAERRLGDTFKALAAEALAANNQGFMALAKEKLQGARQEGDAALEARQKAIEGLMAPVKESLDKVDGKIQELERERAEAYGRLMQQVSGLQAAQRAAGGPRPATWRGRCGRRRCAGAGARSSCAGRSSWRACSSTATSGSRSRWSGRTTRAGGCGPTWWCGCRAGARWWSTPRCRSRGTCRRWRRPATTSGEPRMREHGAQVRAHLQKLSSKAYWSELEGTPEFVVMFLPGEAHLQRGAGAGAGAAGGGGGAPGADGHAHHA